MAHTNGHELPDGFEPSKYLTRVEYHLGRWLISRQLKNGALMARTFRQYGPRGTAILMVARAWSVYVFLLVVAAVVNAVVGSPIASGLLFAIAVFGLLIVIVRAVGAAHSGRRWRNNATHG